MSPFGSHPPRRTILVTGFGAFPGSPRNPTATIVGRLERHRGRLARLGVDLRCAVLPVRYAELQDRMAALSALYRPDVILHLGVAGRRKRVSVETRAINRASPLHPDASRRFPAQMLLTGRAHILSATYPSRRVLAALRQAGTVVETSRDAGDYVCNATLYHSLAMRLAPEIGFIHVPKPHGRSARVGTGARRASQADLDRAALCAVLSLAKGGLHCRPAGPPISEFRAAERAADLPGSRPLPPVPP